MSAVLDENTQFVDSSGAPLVGGFLFFGIQNADPVLNPISIFSDRALTIAIANPQTLDALGRSTNKVWLDGRYSMRVEDLNNVQIYQELDNGESASAGIEGLENVSGADTITATGVTGITSYVDQQQFIFKVAQTNTAAVTLNIDSVGARSVVKNHDKAILPNDFEANQIVIVAYNSTDDVFEWVNQNAKTVTFYEGTPVVAAATTDIWDQSGNTIHITGTTGITSFGTAPNVGAKRTLIFDAAVTLTNSTNLALPGGANFTTEAGDILQVYADTTTQFDVSIIKKDGSAVTQKIVQIITGVLNTTLSTTSTSMVATGVIATITPKSTSNTILVLWNFAGSHGASNYMQLDIRRNDTRIYPTPTSPSNRTPSLGQLILTDGLDIANFAGQFIDNPASVSSLDYEIFFNTTNSGTASFINRSANDTDIIGVSRSSSSITLLELAP